LLFLRLILSFLISGLAYALGALSASGMLAAGVLGGVTFGLGGLRPALVLIWFFASSSLLTNLFRGKKHAASVDYAKGGARDLSQVLANGGAAGAAIVIFALSGWEAAMYAFAGALATANADTWATELGVLSRRRPRLITTGKPVDAGTSGAVSGAGFLAALAGAGTLAALAGWLFGDLRLVSAALIAGFLGSGLDSILGACCQRVYYCPACRKETERHPQHHCGTKTEVLRGAAWLDNDTVNALATLFGALLAGAFTI
jgi:uncharacterized protein (TIGR00297 family)